MGVIVGTAGHVDHGKTTLVRALTAHDTDRLPEEKRRGITLVLGFAPLSLGDGQVAGLVDVPGHERLVRTMVSGAGGVDVLLLVVSAEEGVMPQTKEHLAIADLLGVTAMVVALSQCDRASDELRDLAEADVRDLLLDTRFPDAEVVRCSAVRGDGVEAVRSALRRAIHGLRPAPGMAERPFALPVDRAFVRPGFGTVVTGTSLRGTLAVGDEVDVVGSDARRRRARVRSLQSFGDERGSVGPKQRVAVNLSGVSLDDIGGGCVLAWPGSVVPTRKAAVELRYLADNSAPLRTGLSVSLHVGTDAVPAQITLLEREQLAPGDAGFAFVRPRRPVAVLPGQSFVLRSYGQRTAIGHTVGGGRILDPQPGRLGRRSAQARRHGEALLRWHTDGTALVAEACEVLAEPRGAHGLRISEAARRLGVAAQAISPTHSLLTAEGRVFLRSALRDLTAIITEQLAQFHAQHPIRPGAARSHLQSQLKFPSAAVALAIDEALSDGALIAQADGTVATKAFAASKARSSEADRLWAAIDAGGLAPPSPPELARALKLDAKALPELIRALVTEQRIVRVAPQIYLSTAQLDGARHTLRRWAEDHEQRFTTQDAKTLLGLSRKFLIPLLEHFDRARWTARRGEHRQFFS